MSFTKVAENGEVTLKRATLDWIPKDTEVNNIEDAKTQGKQVVTILDVETTGLLPDKDKIIDIGLLAMTMKNGKLLGKIGHKSCYNDPHEPLKDKIVALTGIKDDDVKDHKLPVQDIKKALKDSDYILAHNASFDRKFCRAAGLDSEGNKWLCSITFIDWLMTFGFSSPKLELLSHFHGYYVGAHRALEDVIATTYLLMQENEGKTYMEYLMEAASEPWYCIQAVGARFAAKDTLKSNDYRWDPKLKVWYKLTTDRAKEVLFLSNQVYRGKNAAEIRQLPLERMFLD